MLSRIQTVEEIADKFGLNAEVNRCLLDPHAHLYLLALRCIYRHALVQ